jgi:acetyltransferase-like isoleucine patch superfamily enzyme
MIRRARYAIMIPLDLWQMFVTYYPGPVGHRLRYMFWKRRLAHLGKGVIIDVGVYFQNPSFITISDGCWIDRGVMILAGQDRSERERRLLSNNCFPLDRGMVYIGRNVHIAQDVAISGIGGVYVSNDCTVAAGSKIYSFSHHYKSDREPWRRDIAFGSRVDHARQFLIEGPVFLGENVGVAMNSVILPNVSIERHSFVAVSSVVKDSFGENSLISGNPATRIRNRFTDE